MTTISYKRLTFTAKIPTRATDGSAGFDLYSDIWDGDGAVSEESVVVIPAGGQALISTGIALEIPRSYVGLICPRSGLSAKYGITVHNGPGVIDSDYRGSIGVILHNTGPKPFGVGHGVRIAQIVILPVLSISLVETDEVEVTDRNDGGFGSTGA